MKSTSEDTAWITRCVLWDDRRAFAHLVDKYQVRLRRFLLHLTGGDSDLADDLAQDTFMNGYEGIKDCLLSRHGFFVSHVIFFTIIIDKRAGVKNSIRQRFRR